MYTENKIPPLKINRNLVETKKWDEKERGKLQRPLDKGKGMKLLLTNKNVLKQLTVWQVSALHSKFIHEFGEREEERDVERQRERKRERGGQTGRRTDREGEREGRQSERSTNKREGREMLMDTKIP